jgi:hypothetical protein
VRKAWAKNAIKKNSMLEDHAKVLFTLGEIMYSYGCPIDTNAITWA